MLFRRIGFCGVDNSVEPELLVALLEQYPQIEWGVLFRSDLEGQPRYPTWTWVLDFTSKLQSKNILDISLAAHLCNDRCKQVLAGDSSFAKQLQDIGFKRIQLNPTQANGIIIEETLIPDYVSNLLKVFNDLPSIEFIFQLNEETLPIWSGLVHKIPSNVSVLHDASCGKGKLISDFPSPLIYPSIPCGYAGGIGPTTIGTVVQNIQQVAQEHIPNLKKPLWIDMESSLRSTILLSDGITDDIFDVNKCMICLKKFKETVG